MSLLAILRGKRTSKPENISPELAEAVRNAYAAVREARVLIQQMADDDEKRAEDHMRRS